MTPAQLRALVTQFQEGRLTEQEGLGVSHGDYSRPSDWRREDHRKRVSPREDLVSDEATTHTLQFIRALFSQPVSPGGYRWKEDAFQAGRTDWAASTIGIESDKAPSRGSNTTIPIVTVIPGPVSELKVTASTLKHFDFATGEETHMGLDVGTIQVVVFASTPTTALRLANLIRNGFRVHRPELKFLHWHEVSEFAMGGYAKGNPASGIPAANNDQSTVPLTFSYFHTYQYRVGPRPGTRPPLRAGVLTAEIDETGAAGDTLATTETLTVYAVDDDT